MSLMGCVGVIVAYVGAWLAERTGNASIGWVGDTDAHMVRMIVVAGGRLEIRARAK